MDKKTIVKLILSDQTEDWNKQANLVLKKLRKKIVGSLSLVF